MLLKGFVMKVRVFLAIAVAAAGFITAEPGVKASTITWTLSTDVPLSDGGMLNGTFTVNSYGYLNGNFWDLNTSGGTLPATSYTTYINASDPNNFTVVFDGPSYQSTLQLTFEYSLLNPIADNPIVGGLDGSSYECAGYSCTSSDIRYVDGGSASSLSATPLPGTLPLFASALGMVGLLAWRKKRKIAASFTAA